MVSILIFLGSLECFGSFWSCFFFVLNARICWAPSPVVFADLQVREILADFAVGQRCEGFEVPRVLHKKKDLATPCGELCGWNKTKELEAFQSLTERFRCNSRKGLIFAVKFGKLLSVFAINYKFLTFCWGWLILGVFHSSVRFGDYLSAFQEELQQLLVDVVAQMEACISYLAYDCLVFGIWLPSNGFWMLGSVGFKAASAANLP